MNRRQLIKHSALAVGAFAAARESFAREIFPSSKELIFRDNAAGPIKLSANENPHGPSPLAKKAMYDAIDASNRYQWDINVTLREQIGKLTGHTKDQIILGAGSSELLGLVTLFASQKKGSAVAAEPTFKLWMPATRKMGLPIQLVQTTAAKDAANNAWFVGRPIMVTRNDYHLNLMNGDVGQCLPTANGLRVAFPDGNGSVRWVLPSRLDAVETVWAMTVHKSQGSEYEHVLMVLPDRDAPVLTRELLYTGVTRAKKQLTWWVPNLAVLISAVRRRVTRSGGLAEVLFHRSK